MNSHSKEFPVLKHKDGNPYKLLTPPEYNNHWYYGIFNTTGVQAMHHRINFHFFPDHTFVIESEHDHFDSEPVASGTYNFSESKILLTYKTEPYEEIHYFYFKEGFAVDKKTKERPILLLNEQQFQKIKSKEKCTYHAYYRKTFSYYDWQKKKHEIYNPVEPRYLTEEDFESDYYKER